MSADSLSAVQRSERMSRVRSKGNRSTELRIETELRERQITGWTKHPEAITGKPDFYFAAEKLALFVDGCFWHGCKLCARRTPSARRGFWKRKLLSNVKRDRAVRRDLQRNGIRVTRIWEHSVRYPHRWVWSLIRRLKMGL